jgi:PAS domain S-box-containing protein
MNTFDPEFRIVFLDALFNNPNVGLCVTKKDTILFCNEKFAKILGYSQEEIKGMNVLDIAHPNDYNSLNRILKDYDSYPEDKVFNIKKKYIRKDKKEVVCFLSTKFFRYRNERYHISVLREVETVEDEAFQNIEIFNSANHMPIIKLTKNFDFVWANDLGKIAFEEIIQKAPKILQKYQKKISQKFKELNQNKSILFNIKIHRLNKIYQVEMIQYNNHIYTYGNDITGLYQLKNNNKQDKIKYLRIINSISEIIIETNENHKVTYVNSVYWEYFSKPNGAYIEDFLPLTKPLEHKLKTNIHSKLQQVKLYSSKLGREKIFDVQIIPKKTKGSIYVLTDITDYIEKKNKEKEIIIHAQEKERQMISRELHDSLGQELLAMKMQIQYLLNQIQNKQEISIPNQLLKIQNKVSLAIQMVRNFSHLLSPMIIKDLSLEKALEHLVNIYHQTSSCKIIFDSSSNLNIPEEKAINIYRIIQEAVKNAIFHGKANLIEIYMHEDKKNLYFEIHDDGSGFEMDRLHELKGIGIKNMKNRIDSLNGTFRIISDPQVGSSLYFSLPLKQHKI